MPFGPADLRKIASMPVGLVGADDLADIRFALEHFTPIKRRDGLAMATYMDNGGKTSMAEDYLSPPIVAFTYFYACDRYDPVSRECTAYDERPPLCSGYPFYGKPLGDPWNTNKALPEECSFRADIGQPVRVMPTRRSS
jgi:Fe-S-cluster containining protein